VTTRPAGTATVASLPRSRPLPARWLVAAVAVLAGALLAGVGTGPASLPLSGVVGELVSVLPGVEVGGLTERQTTILLAIRLPRVVLGAIVGATLATAGATYQGVFRNPLADPYLLGVASGAGLGATITIAAGVRPLGAAVRTSVQPAVPSCPSRNP
jgi:iron complex transport system permease protein